MSTRNYIALAIASLIAAPVTTGCGHTEQEWTAQVARSNSYAVRASKCEDQQGKIVQEFAIMRANASEMEQRLAALGANLDPKSTGVEQFNATAADLRAALEEYRQHQRAINGLRARMASLSQKLEATKGHAAAHVRHNRLVISISSDDLFEKGKTELRASGKVLLIAVADAIRTDPELSEREWLVVGHTDGGKVHMTSPFVDSLGVSVMRARQVVGFLVAPGVAKKGSPGGALVPARWSAAGVGDNDPLVSGDKPENASVNRRIEITLVPDMDETIDLRVLAAPES